MQNQVSPELRRNVDDKMIFGVASGLADYFGVDVAILRVLFVVTAFLSAGTTLLIYLLLAILVPEQERGSSGPDGPDGPLAIPGAGPQSSSDSQRHPYRTSSEPQLIVRRRNIGGWIIVVLGVVLLAANMGLFRSLSFGQFWPLLLIALGVAMILGLFRRQKHRD